MDAAAARLARAVQAGETVAVFGDYDVDGACSAAMITLLLRSLGCPVLTHVPDRITEGYGPNAPALRALAAQGATLVVCVDCGTAAAEPLAALAGLADVLVLDHHKAEGPPPPVLATVNPNRLDDARACAACAPPASPSWPPSPPCARCAAPAGSPPARSRTCARCSTWWRWPPCAT